MRVEQAAFLARVAALAPEIRVLAAANDSAAAFPYAALAMLREAGLLRVSLPAAAGGLDFGDGADGAVALLDLLVELGAAEMAVARVFEAHVNALQLIFRYGTAAQGDAAARDARDGHLFALWVTDPLGGGGVTMAPAGGGFLLAGEKAFCSGAGVASRALITAGSAAGTQMLVMAVEDSARVRPSAIKLSGMRAAVTGAVDFSGLAVGNEAVLGVPGDYLREPVFSAGAWRSAAAACGGLRALLRVHRDELLKRNRDGDAHQRARFGQAVMAYETARLWMAQAALRACLEDAPADEIVAYVNLSRLAVEAACLDALRLMQRSLGLQAFIAGQAVERLARDIATYLRQPAPDETLERAAAFYLAHDFPA